MSWAQRLKRVFKIDKETCEDCGGAVRVIASIEDPLVINRMLAHLERQQPSDREGHAQGPGAPPVTAVSARGYADLDGGTDASLGDRVGRWCSA